MARRLLGRTCVRDALDSAVIALEAAGCDTPRLDAELLLAHVLGVGRAALIASPDARAEPDEARAFMDLAARRRGARAGRLHPRRRRASARSSSPSTRAC